MANLTKIFSDIDLTFTRKPGTNDIALSYDAQSVTRSIRNLLLTNRFERLWNPSLGSNVNRLLFELVTPITGNALESEITSLISNYEPRALVDKVVVTPEPDKNAYTVSLSYYLQNSTLPITVTLILERNR
jgi:phage baseplate assembly protein W